MSPWLAISALVLATAPTVRLANPAFPPPFAPEEPGPVLSRSELAPYFAEGVLAEAKAAFDRGRFDRCRTLLEGVEATPPVRFLRALAADRAKDDATAATEFEALAADYPRLADRCLMEAGQSYERLGRWEDAERALRQVATGGRGGSEAALGLARALRAQGRPAEVLEVLGSMGERPPPPWGRDLGAEALWLEAEALRALGKREAAQAALQALWSGHPLSPLGARAAALVGGAAKLPVAVVVARGEALVEAHRNAEGEALLTSALGRLKLPEPLACRAVLAIGKAQRKQRAHGRAIATLTKVVSQCEDPALVARALFTLGTSQSFVAPEASAASFEALVARAGDDPLVDDALLLAAEAHFKAGARDVAVDRLLELVDRFPDGDSAADGLFRLFWLHRSEGKHAEALAFLEEIEGRFAQREETFEVERARYWRGRVLEELGRADEAVGVFEALSREHPATYYGLIARERVEVLDPDRGAKLLVATAAAPTADDPLPLPLGPLADDPRFWTSVELARLGLGETVPTELLELGRSQLEAEQVRVLVLVLAVAREARAAHGLARVWLRGDLSGPITRERRALWEIAYPHAFRDLVEAHAKEAGELDPDLLQALMREESALDPKALSWAGALGLCQLMPATAAEVAAQLKLPRPSKAMLLEPDLNIRLGGRYLADLLRRARGTTQFALAGYNAGAGAVSRWRQQLGDEDLAAWVEQIPISETRGYVRRVLRSYAAYKLLYNPAGVPRTVLQLSQAAPPKRPKT